MAARRVVGLFLILFIFSSAVGITSASAQAGLSSTFPAVPELTKEVTLVDLGYLKDDTVQGVQSQRNYTINWPKSWLPVQGNQVTIDFSHSDALKRYSSMAVDWNGTRLGSVLLGLGNADRGSITLEIPEDQIQPGYNLLTLQFYMGINDDVCEDPDNPATWATVHSTTSFKFAYELQSPVAELGIYPMPVLETGSLAQNNLTYVLPDQPSVAELNSLAAVSAKLGQLTAWQMTYDVISASQAAAQPVLGDVMWIARADRLPLLGSGNIPVYRDGGFVDQQGQALPETSGIIWEQVRRMIPSQFSFSSLAKPMRLCSKPHRRWPARSRTAACVGSWA